MIRKFVTNESGNFGMITALLLVPLIGACGMAIDYGRALTLRNDLMGAADAAALGAVGENSPGYLAIAKMRNDGRVSIAEEDGRNLFLSHGTLNIREDVVTWPLEVKIDVDKSSGSISSTVSFTVGMPTTFMQIFGKTHVTISGSASAVYGAESKTYTDFYMLLDNTPSMGIAATTSEIKRFQALTKGSGQRGCEFACHLGRTGSDGKFDEDPNSSFLVARRNNITLRIDVVAKAAQSLINRVREEMAQSNDQYHVAAYSFGKEALKDGYRIERVLSATVDMSSASQALGKVSIQTTNHDHFHDNALTSFDTALAAIGQEIVGGGGAARAATIRKR